MEKKEPSYMVGGNIIGIATMENSVEVPQKLKIELPYDMVMPLLSIYIWKR